MIFLQLGQCGIQVGQSIFDKLAIENIDPTIHYPLSLFQQLAIDTERKVWQKRQRNSNIFPAMYIDHGSTGRGNNWAHGFYDDEIVGEILESYRKIVEASYQYDGCMLLHSLAGGTGSGLGSRIALELRDSYPKGALLTSSFAPFSSGETAVQNYNGLLSLSVLQKHADFVGFFSNDLLLKNATRNVQLSGHKSKCDSIPLELLNEHAANCILGTVLPITHIANQNNRKKGNGLTRFNPLDFIYDLAPNPQHKFGMFATSLTHSKIPQSWEDTMTNLIRNIPPDPEYKPMYLLIYNRCLASKLTLRGAVTSEIWDKIPKLHTRISSRIGSNIFNPNPLDVEVSYLYGLNIKDKTQSADVCYNSDSILSHLGQLRDKSKLLYDQKAYLHFYERYAGTDCKDMFNDAFETIDTVIENYSGLGM